MRKLLRSKFRNVIVIDASCLCHAARHAHGLKALSHEDLKTGIIFGFLRSIENIFTKFPTDRFIFAWDTRKNYRKNIYPEYKASRSIPDESKTRYELDQDKAAFEQFDLLREEIIPSLGFHNSFWQEGYEADDLIAAIVMEYAYPSNRFIIVSSDNDLYQLLGYANMYNPRNRKVITAQTLKDDIGLQDPLDWIQVKAMAGCKSDEVIGIKGVGDKTAIQYINGDLVKGKVYDRIQSKESKGVIHRNLKVVQLPFEGTEVPEVKFSEDRFSGYKFLDVCNRYNMNYFLDPKHFQKWKKNFRME